MKIRVRVLLPLFVLSMVLAGVAVAQEPAQPAGPSQAEMEAMMKAMSPGPEHQQMARMVGDWGFTSKMWMAPGAQPSESSGTVHAESILGGRYIQTTWKGNFMGMDFEGHGTEGYDNLAKKYVSSWVDNMSTGILYTTGTCEQGGKVCRQAGSMIDPMTGKDSPWKSVATWTDNNTFQLEMFGNDPTGKEMKMMEFTVKRKK